MKEKILALAQKYADEIGRNINKEPDESIETGLCGNLLFLVELYHHTAEPALLQLLEKGSALLLDRIKSVASFNWSLFTGRAGSIYALLHVYFINRDEKLIDAILEMAKEDQQEFLSSDYVADFLYDGRAGALLVLFNLHWITGREFLTPLINKYIAAILDRATYTNKGMCWKRHEEVSLRPSCGMAFGVSGIQYVFSVINAGCHSKELGFVLKAINSYRNNCWVQDFENWGNYERGIRSAEELEWYTEAYRNGQPAIFEPLDDLFYQRGMCGVLMAGEHEKKLNAFISKFHQIDLSSQDIDLSNGLPGVGMLLWLTDQQKEGTALLNEITTTVFDKVTANVNAGYIDLRLMKGDLGALYFLLKVMGDHKSRENILCPFFDNDFPGQLPGNWLQLEEGAARKKMLAKTFYRSIGILEVAMPDLLNNYCIHNYTDNDITRFSEYLEGIIATMPPNANTSLLADAFDFEKRKYDFFSAEKRTGLQFYLDKLAVRDKSLEFLSQPDDLICACKIGMNDQFLIVSTKRNWSFYKATKKEGAGLGPDQDSEYLLYYSAEMEMVEARLNFMSIVIHQFDTPQFIGSVIDDLKLMLRSLPEPVLIGYAAVVGSTTAQDFMARIDYLLLIFIKQMVYDGFLETKNVTYEITI